MCVSLLCAISKKIKKIFLGCQTSMERYTMFKKVVCVMIYSMFEENSIWAFSGGGIDLE